MQRLSGSERELARGPVAGRTRQNFSIPLCPARSRLRAFAELTNSAGRS